jgi:NAD(P)H dehydrogenase (quinone)
MKDNSMKVLTVYAHPNPKSFCHAVLERFTAGLKDAGHTSEVVDLYAIRFNPVFGMRDFAGFIHESIPVDVLEQMNLKQRILDSSGGFLQRFVVSRWLERNPDPVAMAKLIRSQMPKDIVAQQEKIAQAQALAFIAPVFWCHFPAILKGWFERVFNYGFAFALTPEGWRGEVKGRVPLLRHEKALIITPTLFKEDNYARAGLEEAMTTLIDNWGLRYPGIKKVEHVFFYAVDSTNSQSYLERAYRLGKEFDQI